LPRHAQEQTHIFADNPTTRFYTKYERGDPSYADIVAARVVEDSSVYG
jgi:hypothetical protein